MMRVFLYGNKGNNLNRLFTRQYLSSWDNSVRRMGQTLSEPVTTKESACCQNKDFYVGSSCMQGWRVSMEDSHTHILSLPDDPGTAFFAVFDGHGGAKVAEYAGKHLHKFVTSRTEYKEGNIAEAMKQAFLEIDVAMQRDEGIRNEQAGTTAVAVVVQGDQLYCANAGDSRAVASVNGRAEPLSLDHKPSNKIEFNRITAAGGWVDCNRVNGNLALSRALGDFVFKRNSQKKAEEQIVSAYPDVEIRTISPEWEFVVLACDGIWDVLSNEEVVSFVREQIAAGNDPEEICEELMMRCLAPDCEMGGLGCDNMTVVLVCLLQDGTYEQLGEKCAKKFNHATVSTFENLLKAEQETSQGGESKEGLYKIAQNDEPPTAADILASEDMDLK